MFIEVDIVEFTNADIPYTTVMINLWSVIQVQPIGNRHREIYNARRDAAIQKQLTDPNLKVSPVEDLPSSGAVIYLIEGPQAPLCYTVTPYTEIRELIFKLQRNTAT